MQDAAIPNQTAASLRAVLAPKVAGAAALAAATTMAPISGIAHFSSISAMFGTAGQANYAAANEVLNETAAAQQESGIASISVMWGAWAVGMAASDPSLAARAERAGMGIITPGGGLAALVSALSGGQAAVVAAPITWSRFMAGNAIVAGAPVFSSFRPAATALAPPLAASARSAQYGVSSRPPLAAKALSLADVQGQIAGMVHAMLGSNISVDQPLMEAGLDSLSAVELRNSLSDAFGTDLPATVIFDYPSITTLAAFIVERAGESSAAAQLSAAPGRQPGNTAAMTMDVGKELQAIVEAMLGAAVPAEQPLMEAGLDLLSAVELRNALGDKFGMELPATVMFDYPSAAALTAFITERINPASAVAPLSYSDTAALAEALTLSSTDVVGISARYPGQTTGAGGFWQTITTATDLQRRIPHDRWDLERWYAVDIVPGNPAINAPFAAFCDNVGDFDAAAFRLSSAESIAMDPQQRLLMEESHGALLDAAPHMADITGALTGGS